MKRLGCRETSFFFYPFGVTHFAQKGITKKRFACLSKLKRTNRFSFAEKGGFEPPVPLRVRQFSKLLVSATHPSLLVPPIKGRRDNAFASEICFISQKRVQRYNKILKYTNIFAFFLCISQKSCNFVPKNRQLCKKTRKLSVSF